MGYSMRRKANVEQGKRNINTKSVNKNQDESDIFTLN